MATTINPKCNECYGSGWLHTIREQDEDWYDRNPDRSRPSYYSTRVPCSSCNLHPAVSPLRRLRARILSTLAER
jgi:hypothetical protein